MRFPQHTITILLLLAPLSLHGGGPEDPTFGETSDVNFAVDLWQALEEVRLVGPDRINVQPFRGNEPHGAIQQVLASDLEMNGRTAEVRVKHNHGGPDVSVQSVYDEPNKDIKAVTVMFKREAGYDPENLNWFWAKYRPDGSLDQNPQGRKLAGRVAKGTNGGCIACHTALGGADLETLTTR